MLNVIIVMTIGIILGAFLHKNKKLFVQLDRFITYAIWLLLFLLGLSIGTNGIIVKNICNLGFQAIIVTFFTISFSVLVSCFLFVTLFKNEE